MQIIRIIEKNGGREEVIHFVAICGRRNQSEEKS